MKRASPLRRLLSYTTPHRRTVQLAALCSFLNKVFDIAPEILIGMAVNLVTGAPVPLLRFLGPVTPVTGLYWLAALTLVIWVLESLFEFLYEVQWRGLAQTIQHELRLDAYGK